MTTFSYALNVPVIAPTPTTGNAVPIVGPVRDLALDADGDLLIAKGDLCLISGAPAARQGATLRLKLFQGEWFLDTEAGIPYFERILVKNPNLAEAREWFRLALVGTPDIAEVIHIVLGATKNRQMQVYWTAATATGAAILSEEGVTVP